MRVLVLLFLSACASSVEVAGQEQDFIGCPFTRSNMLTFGAQHISGTTPSGASASDCVNVANATELGRGTSYICSKAHQYARIFIPLQVSGCTMHSYVQGCGEGGNSGCYGVWHSIRCDGYSLDSQAECWEE